MEKVTFVVREQRDREHDPIIGIVHFDTLGDAFQDGSQVTRWYPIVRVLSSRLVYAVTLA
jgi:hypothetical protein